MWCSLYVHPHLSRERLPESHPYRWFAEDRVNGSRTHRELGTGDRRRGRVDVPRRRLEMMGSPPATMEEPVVGPSFHIPMLLPNLFIDSFCVIPLSRGFAAYHVCAVFPQVQAYSILTWMSRKTRPDRSFLNITIQCPLTSFQLLLRGGLELLAGFRPSLFRLRGRHTELRLTA